jgi:type I restriction enzyme, S subunit
MSFPKYPAYKDSGVEWLGEVPEHWSISPLKFSASCNDSVLPDSTDDEYEIEYVEISDVDEISGITGSTTYKFSDAPSRARRILQDGDVLISTVRTYLRAIAPVVSPPINLIASTGFAVVRPRKGTLDGAFLGYLLRAEWWISEIIARSVGVSYPAINASDLIGLNVPIPPWHEQTQIARFLDHETARTDALIEEQQRLIELLKEKRQAVISHAVTKGLDPTVPMKYSGVEWLGEVPAHWDVVRVGTVYSEAAEKGLAELPVLRVSIHYGVSDKELTEEESDRKITRIDDREKYKCVRPGDLVYNMMRAWQGGFGAVLVHGLVSPAYVVARPKSEGLSRYVEQLLRTGCAVEEMRKNSYGITDFRLRLYWDQFKNIRIAVPPESERRQIMLRIDSLISESDALRNEADVLISILQERRSALISAAVTGKIDVRGWQPPTHAQAPELEVAEAV